MTGANQTGAFYNVHGQKVATLINKKENPDSYIMERDARKIARGIFTTI
jgi:hypothetical protein